METNIQEIWKDIPSFEGLYQASNLGRIRSLDRKITYFRYGQFTDMIKPGRILRPTSNGYYLIVVLCSPNGKRSISVHQLVAMAWHGHKPNGNTMVVNHKDLNKLNNCEWNLEVTTNRANSNKKHIPHTSKYTGVHKRLNFNKWIASTMVNGKHIYLGCFETEEQAHMAYENVNKNL